MLDTCLAHTHIHSVANFLLQVMFSQYESNLNYIENVMSAKNFSSYCTSQLSTLWVPRIVVNCILILCQTNPLTMHNMQTIK